MNLLVDSLPADVEIGGRRVPISTSHTAGIRFELLMQESGISASEKVRRALELYYGEVPEDIAAAMERMLWFYSCGRETPERTASGEDRPAGRAKKLYCFEQDAELIFAAFRAHYGIDLAAGTELHWWKFRALFTGLPGDCEFVKVMGYRGADTRDMPKRQRRFYERMQRLHRLENRADAASTISLAERDQKMKDYVARRMDAGTAGGGRAACDLT